MKVFHGNIVYSKNKDEIIEKEDAYIVVNDKGIIEGIYARFPKAYANYELIDFKDNVIIPAFSDLHVHAPQYPNRGVAMDKILKDWLNDYTFPLEAKYKDEAFAKEVYEKFVHDLIKHGTMHASIFATIHPSSTSILVDILEKNKILS